MHTYTYEILKEKNLIIFDCIAGSKAYNTSTETSDEDKRFVYVQPLNDILGFGYVPQVTNETNDIMGWEIKRFIELLSEGKPNAIELLKIPAHCVITNTRQFNYLLDYSHKFLTKKFTKSLGRAAKSQVTKTKGTDKKMNWSKQRTERKTVLDFCNIVMPNGGSQKVEKWLDNRDWNQAFCGLTKIPNFRDGYALFYDFKADGNNFVFGIPNDKPNLGYQGIVRDLDKSNDVCVSAIPKGKEFNAILTFNKDGYSEHCKDYRDYLAWVEDHNPNRLVDTQRHGQAADGKNLLHCVRYLKIAREIATGQGLNIWREHDREELLKIKRGDLDLFKLIDWAKSESEEIEKLVEASNLPEDVSPEFLDSLLTVIRRDFYHL